MENKKIQLTSKEIEKLGDKVRDFLPSLELIMELCDNTMYLNKKEHDRGFSMLKTDKTLGVIYDHMQVMARELDKVAFPLLECTNKKEIEALREWND